MVVEISDWAAILSDSKNEAKHNRIGEKPWK